MTDFTKIKSKYVLKKLKKTDDKHYIEDLMFIERWITGPRKLEKVFTVACDRCFHEFYHKKYKKESVEIFKELDPTRKKRCNSKEKSKEESELIKRIEKCMNRNRIESERTWETMKSRRVL